jgi:hypothetical protein
MADRASRYFMDQDQKQRDRSDLREARSALEKFRRDGDPSGFPNLRKHLWRKSSGLSQRYFNLDGFGREDEWRLTEEEYERFKSAYKATDAGAADDWSSGLW